MISVVNIEAIYIPRPPFSYHHHHHRICRVFPLSSAQPHWHKMPFFVILSISLFVSWTFFILISILYWLFPDVRMTNNNVIKYRAWFCSRCNSGLCTTLHSNSWELSFFYGHFQKSRHEVCQEPNYQGCYLKGKSDKKIWEEKDGNYKFFSTTRILKFKTNWCLRFSLPSIILANLLGNRTLL